MLWFKPLSDPFLSGGSPCLLAGLSCNPAWLTVFLNTHPHPQGWLVASVTSKGSALHQEEWFLNTGV